jgi:hypothetical protein
MSSGLSAWPCGGTDRLIKADGSINNPCITNPTNFSAATYDVTATNPVCPIFFEMSF